MSDTQVSYEEYQEARERLQDFSLAGDEGNPAIYNFREATGGRATLSMGNILSDRK